MYVDRETFFARRPKNRVADVILGAFLGLIFPVCECGVVPLTRRLSKKGLPLSMRITFLLAAPVLNPIVILGTCTAFASGPAPSFGEGSASVRCVADAAAIGIAVLPPAGMNLPNGWVRVQGGITTAAFTGEEAPVILADSITLAEEPNQPYLYP